jgi:thiamine-monophosphate kinase
MKTTPQKELEFLKNLRKRVPQPRSGSPVRLGMGDDCAILKPPLGAEVVVTTDFSLEGRHFRRDWHSSRSVGHRCLARGLSDLAAMGATPMAAFLSLALPAGTLQKATGRAWVEKFFDGLLNLAKTHDVILAGGDTATAPGSEILADILLLGSVPRRRALLRSGARAGDNLYVTGNLGGSAAELAVLSKTPRKFSNAKVGEVHPHLYPVPRIRVGQALLRRKLATSAIDISDGLSTDLLHLCEESRVSAILDAASIPLGPDASVDQALHGGEDYELLFTSSARMPSTIAGVHITRIGAIEAARRGQPAIRIRTQGGSIVPLIPQGWQHSL